jgi:hypothetical protein
MSEDTKRVMWGAAMAISLVMLIVAITVFANAIRDSRQAEEEERDLEHHSGAWVEPSQLILINAYAEGVQPGNQEVYVLLDLKTECEFFIYKDRDLRVTTVDRVPGTCLAEKEGR